MAVTSITKIARRIYFKINCLYKKLKNVPSCIICKIEDYLTLGILGTQCFMNS